MRPRRRFGMILNREDGQTAVTDAFQRSVVEIDMSRLQVAGQVVLLDREAVILRGDLDLFGEAVQHRLVGPAVAEFEFEGVAAEGEAEKLVAEADAEYRLAGGDQVFHRLNGVADGGGVPGAVREEDAVGIVGEHFLGRRGAGDDRDLTTDLG